MSGADKRRTARRAFVPDKEWTREEVDAFIEHNPIGFSVYCGRHEPRDFIATFRRTTNRFDGTPTWAPHPFWIDGDRYGRTRDNCGLQAIDGVGHVVPFSWTAVFDPDPHNPLSKLVYLERVGKVIRRACVTNVTGVASVACGEEQALPFRPDRRPVGADRAVGARAADGWSSARTAAPHRGPILE